MQEEIYSSSYAAAAYLEYIKFPKEKKVFLSPLQAVQIQLCWYLQRKCLLLDCALSQLVDMARNF